ncbi:hypothetical protein BGZ47_002046 [Haplosporangium gracile]|nr:hypothetical protein BGZ47_002046 [Haplosporangium gracile]
MFTIEMLKEDYDAREQSDLLWAAQLPGNEVLFISFVVLLFGIGKNKIWDPGPMLERITQPATYRYAILDISQNPHIKESYNAHIKDVTKPLAGKGLVKEEEPTSCPLSTAAHRWTRFP